MCGGGIHSISALVHESDGFGRAAAHPCAAEFMRKGDAVARGGLGQSGAFGNR